MKIAIASDHAGFNYKSHFVKALCAEGHEVRDFGTHSTEPIDYPEFIRAAAQSVAQGDCERGIVIGGSGNGEAMAANKVRGVRCALCWNVETARLSREHNNANMLAIGERMISAETALDLARVWLETPFEGGRHFHRVQQLVAIEDEMASTPAGAFLTHEKTVLIRPEYLNQFGGLFGGYMMQWADDMAFNAASLTFPDSHFVTRRFDAFDFTAPVGNGDIIRIYSRVERVGTTSCQAGVWCLNARTNARVFSTVAVMVNINAEGRKAAINYSAK